MKLHVIVDFMYLYYKYVFTYRSGRLRSLTAPMMVDGIKRNLDISMIYYPLKEIEDIRRRWETAGHDVTMSICFDSKSDRAEEDADYKAHRENKLDDDDFANVDMIREKVIQAGYNVYKEPGVEADDLVTSLVNRYKREFNFTLIYTPDADILVNLQPGVGVMRYKSKTGYHTVSHENMCEVLGEELKCTMPYNAILLFKCTSGDKSDGIKGVSGFGPAAFTKYVDALEDEGVDFERLTDLDYLEGVIRGSGHLLKKGEEAVAEALDALKMAGFRDIEVAYPNKVGTKELREIAYEGMPSLIK